LAKHAGETVEEARLIKVLRALQLSLGYAVVDDIGYLRLYDAIDVRNFLPRLWGNVDLEFAVEPRAVLIGPYILGDLHLVNELLVQPGILVVGNYLRENVQRGVIGREALDRVPGVEEPRQLYPVFQNQERVPRNHYPRNTRSPCHRRPPRYAAKVLRDHLLDRVRIEVAA